jgi:hypothetical protein
LAQQETEQKNVLVLASYSPTVPVASFWDKGIRSVFDNSSTPPAKIDIEYLYHHRIQDPHYRKLLVDLYHYKYSKEKPDLIIAIYSAALDFALKYGSDHSCEPIEVTCLDVIAIEPCFGLRISGKQKGLKKTKSFSQALL